MKLEISPVIYSKCKIVSFDLVGTIVGLSQGRNGTELQVSYYLNGEHKVEWFYDFEVNLV